MTRRFTRDVFTLATCAAIASAASGAPAGAGLRRDWDEAELAGLRAGGRLEPLTWQRAYTLPLVHARAPRSAAGPPTATPLDPAALARKANRLGVADFERFRRDFFATRGATPDGRPAFVDPSESLLNLLQRRQALDSSRKLVAALEELKASYQQVHAGEPNPPRPTRLEGHLEKAIARFQTDLRAYREGISRVKTELGLAPDAPVVADRTALA